MQWGHSYLIYLNLLLIALSCDVSKNPGPEFPCGHCDLEVQLDQKGVCRDDCQTWYQTDCQNINSVLHEAL